MSLVMTEYFKIDSSIQQKSKGLKDLVVIALLFPSLYLLIYLVFGPLEDPVNYWNDLVFIIVYFIGLFAHSKSLFKLYCRPLIEYKNNTLILYHSINSIGLLKKIEMSEIDKIILRNKTDWGSFERDGWLTLTINYFDSSQLAVLIRFIETLPIKHELPA